MFFQTLNPSFLASNSFRCQLCCKSSNVWMTTRQHVWVLIMWQTTSFTSKLSHAPASESHLFCSARYLVDLRVCQSGRKFFCLSLKIQCIKLLVVAIAHSEWKKLYHECTSINRNIKLNCNDEGTQVMALTNWIKCRNPIRSNRTSTRQHDFSWA